MNTDVKNCADFAPNELKVLQEYRLVDASGALVEVHLERPEDAPLGLGPKMDLQAIQKLIAADTTPDKRWLNWIFFQAGGGQRAKDASKRALEQTKERFIDERVNGFENLDTKERFKPVPKAEAEARWVAVEPRWAELLISADQDIVDHLGVFGYHRSWPGKDKVYSRVATCVRKFLQLRAKAEAMNEERRAQSTQLIAFEPEAYATLDDLDKIVSKIERYYVSKFARDDVQVDIIFEDDRLRVIAPLTYAASVRYGFDTWPFSNRATFEEVLENENSFRDAWKSTTSSNVLVFFAWKVPMPSWISRKNSDFIRYELTNLATALSRPTLEAVSDRAIMFYDEENVSALNLAQVWDMIKNEPTRTLDAQDEELPVKRGLNAYTAPEAELRLKSFGQAVEAVKRWAANFDVSRIKTDALSSGKETDLG